MNYQDSSEPIDFDFFDETPSTKRSSTINSPDGKPNRPLSGKRSGSARGYDGDYDRESVRSVASSRSSVSVRIPTATPTQDHDDDGNEADYYSDDFEDSDREGQRAKNGSDTFRLKDDIDALKDGRRARNGKSFPTSANSKTRPKSSVRRRRSESSSSNASTESSRSSSSFTSESSRSHRDNDSVTDVSPLASPPSSPIPKLEYDEQEMERETERMRSVHFQEEDQTDSYRDSHERRAKGRPKSSKPRDGGRVTKTPGYSQYHEDPRQRETEAKELSMLLRAVLELDETPKESDLSTLHKNLKRPLSGKRKNRPQSAPMPHQRMNMSFSNDEVRRIDRDNRRLLEKIVGGKSSQATGTRSGRTTRPSSAKRTSFAPEKPVSHSAVKRQRDQRRIEIENMQILKRIEAARANPGVKKDSLLKDYHQQMQYATQVSKTPGGPRPVSAKRAGKAYRGGEMNRASSMSSLGTDISADTFTSSSTSRSRPRSAKWSGGYRAGRPAWDDRFYLDD